MWHSHSWLRLLGWTPSWSEPDMVSRQHTPSLFVAERDHRVDLHRPAGREVAGRQRDQQ